jgi:hypothetical protein
VATLIQYWEPSTTLDVVYAIGKEICDSHDCSPVFTYFLFWTVWVFKLTSVGKDIKCFSSISHLWVHNFRSTVVSCSDRMCDKSPRQAFATQTGVSMECVTLTQCLRWVRDVLENGTNGIILWLNLLTAGNYVPINVDSGPQLGPFSRGFDDECPLSRHDGK